MYSRPNGDELSIVLSPDGTLSTAHLLVKGEQWDVSSYLPSICESNLNAYVRMLGFTGRDNRIDGVQGYLEECECSIDAVVSIHSPIVKLFVIENDSRCTPCPPVIAVAVFDYVAVSIQTISVLNISACKSVLGIR